MSDLQDVRKATMRYKIAGAILIVTAAAAVGWHNARGARESRVTSHASVRHPIVLTGSAAKADNSPSGSFLEHETQKAAEARAAAIEAEIKQAVQSGDYSALELKLAEDDATTR